MKLSNHMDKGKVVQDTVFSSPEEAVGCQPKENTAHMVPSKPD
jgi:hypothetical protein